MRFRGDVRLLHPSLSLSDDISVLPPRTRPKMIRARSKYGTEICIRDRDGKMSASDVPFIDPNDAYLLLSVRQTAQEWSKWRVNVCSDSGLPDSVKCHLLGRGSLAAPHLAPLKKRALATSQSHRLNPYPR